MAQKKKLIQRLLRNPKDFSWDELTKLLIGLGFKEISSGKTGGSRRKFYNNEKQLMINLHKPHPANIVKNYAIKQIIQKLKDARIL